MNLEPSFEKIYQGMEPFIFVSYSHKNEKKVKVIIEKLMIDGYRVWYDNGISAGKVWRDMIAKRILECDVFIAFISNDYVDSKYCIRELDLAESNNIQYFAVFLEETKLPPGMQLQLSGLQSLRFYNTPFDVFFSKLYSGPLNACKCSNFEAESGENECNKGDFDIEKNPVEKKLILFSKTSNVKSEEALKADEHNFENANKSFTGSEMIVNPVSKATYVDQNSGKNTEKSDKTEEQKELIEKCFGKFMYSEKMKEQIMNAIENVSLGAYTGNLLVTSEKTESAEQFVKTFISYLKLSEPFFVGKNAKIGAKTFNKKDVNEIFELLTDGGLIIFHAGWLANSSINNILSNLNQDQRGVVVFLCDTENEINRLLERAPILKRFFTIRVDIE